MVGEQMAIVPLRSIIQGSYRLRTRVSLEQAVEIQRMQGFDMGYVTGQTLGDDASLEDVGSLLQQHGIASGLPQDYELSLTGKGPRIKLKPREHEYNGGPCEWTLGWVEGAASAITDCSVSVDRQACISGGGTTQCNYLLLTSPKKELKSTYPAKAAYSLPLEGSAIRHFGRALEEGRPGLAVTSNSTEEVRAQLSKPDLECWEIGEGPTAHLSPLGAETLETLWRTTVRKDPDVAILFSAVPTISGVVADPSMARVLHSLAKEVTGPTSSAVAFVVIPERLRGRWPLAEGLYRTEVEA
ncbi:MAG TPA: hypothetical protein VI933_01950 [archaeon]|nr:hypothetical protein [archaeon]